MKKKRWNTSLKLNSFCSHLKNDHDRFYLALMKLYEAIKPTKLDRSLVQSVRVDFEAIGKLNYVAYCDGLLLGGNFVGG